MVDAFADGGGFLPALGVLDVGEPPGIGAALGRASVVDGAGVVVQEDAGVGVRRVDQGTAALDLAGVFADEGANGQANKTGKSFQISG